MINDEAFLQETQTRNMSEPSREKFWAEIKKVLTNKEYAVLTLSLRQNMKQIEVSNILQIPRNKVKEIYTEAVSKIVNTECLVDYLSYLSKPTE